MGRGLAKLLAQKGANVVIVARNQQKLSAAVEYMRSAAKNPQSQRFHSVSADLTKPEENERIISEVTQWNNGNPPDIVWANAGSAHPTLFIDTPIDVHRSQMDIDYWAASYLGHATLRSWLKPASSKSAGTDAKPRHFIITSSVACFAGLAGYTPYAPAKAALRSLADTLRSEMNLYNGYRAANPEKGPAAEVKIHCVFPGTITSPGWENENKVKHDVTKKLEESDPRQTEDEVAVAAVKGLENGGYMIATQWLASLMRASMMGGSPRNNVFMDTIVGWVAYVAWLFIGPDLESKVYRYGEEHEVKLPQ